MSQRVALVLPRTVKYFQEMHGRFPPRKEIKLKGKNNPWEVGIYY